MKLGKVLTAEQIQWVLNDLPPPYQVDGEYYKVFVREYRSITPHDGQKPCNENARFFEFRKSGSGHQWVLASVPPF